MQKMRLMFALVALFAAAVPAFAEPVSFKVTENTTIILPLQVVQGVQLYCPELGKGFPGAETVLVTRKAWRLSAGAAPILGTEVNVPFVSLSTRLSPKFFDTSDNQLYFGVWAGKPSNKDRAVFGISASVALW
jgi:hypothetical protein